MTRKTAQLLDIQQTLTILVHKLGSPVAWAAWLGDLRRSPRPGIAEPHMYGHKLYPYAIANRKQPLYRRADVMDFINAVKAADPERDPLEKPHRYVFEDHPLLSWRMRQARRSITPLKSCTFHIRHRKPRPCTAKASDHPV